MHYNSLDYLFKFIDEKVLQRFWPKINKKSGVFGFDNKYSSECWLWRANTKPNGYGIFSLKRKYIHAHRLSYFIYHGNIDSTLVIDHLCKNRNCVNPTHLELITLKLNNKRGLKGNVSHCVHGHEFDATNTYIKSNGTRSCRKCHARRERDRKALAKS